MSWVDDHQLNKFHKLIQQAATFEAVNECNI